MQFNHAINKILSNNTFVISLEKTDVSKENGPTNTIISSATTSYGHLILSRWHQVPGKQSNVICLSVENDCPLLRYTRENLKSNERLIITSSYPCEAGLKGMNLKYNMISVKFKTIIP